MSRFVARSAMEVGPRELWDWHTRRGAFERLNPGWEGARVVQGYGVLAEGSRLVLSVSIGPFSTRWVAGHQGLVEGREFKDVQEQALEMYKPGSNGKDIQLSVKEKIEDNPFGAKFIHSVTHTIGLAVHDGYAFRPNQDLILEEGMVFTVEPGLYLPGYGGVRIEDDVVVRPGGCEILTTATKDLIVVD